MENLRKSNKEFHIAFLVMGFVIMFQIGFGLKYAIDGQANIKANQAVIMKNQNLLMSAIKDVNDDIENRKKIVVPNN